VVAIWLLFRIVELCHERVCQRLLRPLQSNARMDRDRNRDRDFERQ
jgi:hypothetical protein